MNSKLKLKNIFKVKECERSSLKLAESWQFEKISACKQESVSLKGQASQTRPKGKYIVRNKHQEDVSYIYKSIKKERTKY